MPQLKYQSSAQKRNLNEGAANEVAKMQTIVVCHLIFLEVCSDGDAGAVSRRSVRQANARVAIREPMGSHSQLSGSQPAAGIEAFRRKCWLGEHAAQAKLSTQRDAASSSQDDDQDELSCCGSSASDRSLDSSDVSFCPSFEEESDTDSEGDDGIEEVSSPMPGSSPRAAQQRQHQRVREAVIGVDAQLASAVPLPLDWLAQQAIPTTPDLDEALRSNGQLAYVPACSATPAALSLLASSSAKLHPAQVGCLTYMHPCSGSTWSSVPALHGQGRFTRRHAHCAASQDCE